jgi:hypothetical protein
MMQTPNDPIDEVTSLEELFERYESMPSLDAEEAKRELVDRMLAVMARRLAETDDVADFDRYRPVRDATSRVRLLAPGADGFDDAVLGLIDAARDAFARHVLTEGVRASPPRRGSANGSAGDRVTQASEESFPASDPPGYAAGGGSP